jgi:GNAT superfamily N-acetyltransferase
MPEPLAQSHGEGGIRIRQATLADRDALIELSRIVFEQTGTDKINELGTDFWEWQFARQPSNRMGVWLAEFDGQIVAQLPTNIVRLKWRNRELLAAVVIDLMVHPAHRNKSLFVKLGRAAHAEMAKTGIAITAGLPNKNSYPGAVRFLKYQPVCRIPLLILPVRWSHLLERAGVPAWLSGPLGLLAGVGCRLITRPAPRTSSSVHVREVAEFPDAIDEFWQRVSPAHKIMTVRDLKYLTWRYRGCPTRAYTIHVAESDGRLVGYLVRRVFEKDGLRLGALMDVLVDPAGSDALHALVEKAIEAFCNEKVDAVASLMQKDKLYYPGLRRHGFVPVPERFNPRTFNFVCKLLWPDLPESEFRSPENWFLALGDYDVY